MNYKNQARHGIVCLWSCTWEGEAERSLDYRNSRPAWATVRPCSQRKQTPLSIMNNVCYTMWVPYIIWYLQGDLGKGPINKTHYEYKFTNIYTKSQTIKCFILANRQICDRSLLGQLGLFYLGLDLDHYGWSLSQAKHSKNRLILAIWSVLDSWSSCLSFSLKIYIHGYL